MGIFGALVKRSHLALVAVGAVLLIVAAIGGIPLGSQPLLIAEPVWRYVLAGVGIVILGIGIYLVWREHVETTDPPPPKAFDKFLQIGMCTIQDCLTDADLRGHLGNALHIKVLKTWFPESPEIETGLKLAIKNGAKVRLLLCKPGSVILAQRSLSAGEHASTGSSKVYRAVERVRELVITTPHTDVQIALYESWPGCPVIWYDDDILMGFYFRGESSPKWPWIRVTRESQLAGILDRQFKELWGHGLDAKKPDAPTEGPDTPERMAKWLEDNKPDTATEQLDTPERMAKWLEDNNRWQAE